MPLVPAQKPCLPTRWPGLQTLLVVAAVTGAHGCSRNTVDEQALQSLGSLAVLSLRVDRDVVADMPSAGAGADKGLGVAEDLRAPLHSLLANELGTGFRLSDDDGVRAWLEQVPEAEGVVDVRGFPALALRQDEATLGRAAQDLHVDAVLTVHFRLRLALVSGGSVANCSGLFQLVTADGVEAWSSRHNGKTDLRELQTDPAAQGGAARPALARACLEATTRALGDLNRRREGRQAGGT